MAVMKTVRVAVVLALLAVTATACTQDDGGSPGADLAIERRTGYVVAIEEESAGLMIGFDENRDAPGGEQFDVSGSLWRVDDGLWNEPPVTCLGLGRRVEIGVAEVQNEARPGLLMERVIWVACLEADAE